MNESRQKLICLIQNAPNDRIKMLVDIQKKQLNERLSFNQAFQNTYPNNLGQYAPLIVDSFLLYGGNDIANLLRGIKGPSYHSVLCKVGRKLKANFNRNADDELIEECILYKVIEKYFGAMSDEDLKKILEEMEIHSFGGGKQAMLAAILYAFRAGGFTSYKILVILANYVCRMVLGRGLTFAANAALTRLTCSWLNPAVATIIGILTVKDLTGPAYRVIIPSVILIALMRAEQKYLSDHSEVA